MKISSFNIESELHQEVLQTNDAPSRNVIDEKYIILNLRYVSRSKNGLVYKNAKFLIQDNGVYRLEDEHAYKLSSFKDFHDVIDGLLDYQESIIDHYVDTVELLEDQVFDKNQSRNLVRELFELKRDFFKLARTLERFGIVLNEFITKNKVLLGAHAHSLNELHGNTENLQRVVKTQAEKLETLYGYYSSLKNDTLNRNIYILSVISGIFLPLNLIVGFFGMNTTGLFLSNHPNGTSIVFNSILGIFVFLLIGFPFLHVIDKYLFSKLFGKFSLYSRMSRRLENISDEFNILKE